MSRAKKIGITTAIGLVMYGIGRVVAVSFALPFYLHLSGIIFSAYFGGPIAGVLTTVLGCGISCVWVKSDWLFFGASVIVAIIAGKFSQKNRYLEHSGISIVMATTLSCAHTLFLLLPNVIFQGGKTALAWPNAVMDILNRVGFSYGMQCMLASLYLSFMDVLCAQTVLFVGIHLVRYTKKKKRARELRHRLGGKMVIGVLICGLLLPDIQVGATREDKALNSRIQFVERWYNSTSGLTGGCANAIAQTPDGALWVGTYGGLFRFDGKEFTMARDVNVARSVNSLYVDQMGVLWVGTNGLGVATFFNNKEHITVNMASGLPSDTVKAIVQDCFGKYYFGTIGGVAMAVRNKDTVIIKKVETQIGSVLGMSADTRGNVAIVNTEGEVYILRDGEVLRKIAVDGQATSVNFGSDGKLYIGTQNEFVAIYRKKNSKYVLLKSVKAKGFQRINDVLFDGMGVTYIASDSGIGFFNNSGSVRTIGTEAFDSSVNHIFKDYQGNIWFTSSRCGLLNLSRSCFVDLFSVCNEEAKVVNTIQKWNNNWYVGTDRGLVVLDEKRGKSKHNALVRLFTDDRIRTIAPTKEGTLLIAGYQSGLYELFKDGRFKRYLDGDISEEQGIRQIKVLQNGEIFTSDEKGLRILKQHKIVKRLRLGIELPATRILNLLEVEPGVVFAGTDGAGVWQIQHEKATLLADKKDGLPVGVVLRVVKDREGSGYFVLTGSGMVYMSKNGKVRAIEGIPFYNNYDLFQNKDGKVFVVGGAGVFVFDYGELMDEKKVPDYTLMDAKAGLPGNLTSNAWNYLDSEGHLYLAGSSGVYSFDTKNYRVEVSAYRSEVKQIKYDGKKENTVGRKGIIIPRGVKEIELDLGVNNFTATDPMIRYYMSGVDAKKHVVYASKLEPIFYHELQFGNHEFHIEIVSAEGKVLAENEYTFWKERELYETFAFRLYFFLVLACMMFFFLFTILYCGVTLLMKRQRDEHEQVVAKLEREKADALEWALHSEEAANQSKSDFLATMSHEIRTPINAILGMNTMIMREAKQEEIKKYSKDIHNASKTLLTLINDILDFSKIESGRLELVQGVYCLGDVVEDLLNMVKPKAEDKNLTLNVEINPNIPNRLYGDDVRIEQAILNILNNAVKYTEKGSVTLWMDYDSFASGDILLKVRVSDTGIGIKEEDVAKLFSPYQRIDEQRNKKVEGTGLGMTITKNLLEKMGSTLEVSSVYGEGSTFSFAIIQPVRGEETLREYQEKGGKNQSDGIEREHFHAPDARILVVDDMKVNLMVVSGLLKRLELKIDTALSGKIAVQLAKEKAYDMILLDSMMPEMNGEETMRMIKRECPLNAKTPMVVLTAHAVKGAREGYLQMGYTDYLSKPIEAGAVEAMIQKYLPQEKIKS